MTALTIRSYRSDDEPGWLLCRLLSFFDTCYYDDVKIDKTSLDGEPIELVAEEDGVIVGVLDIEIDGTSATIDTVAVHPEFRGRGIATALLDAALPRLAERAVATLDAWTREDRGAIGWYEASGFRENFSYLHVYKQWDEPGEGFDSPPPLSRPVMAFLHAPRDQESDLRARYRRVYVCRQMLRRL